jgi:hypothetical protein
MRMKPMQKLFPYAFAASLLAAAGAVLSACEPVSGSEKEQWFGLVSEGCAPNDAPTLRFQIDTSAYIGCGTQHAGEFSTLVNNAGFIDPLQPGQVVVDTQTICPVEKCANRTVIRIEILSVDSASVKADIRVESNATGTKVIRSGKAVLSRCPNKFVCG